MKSILIAIILASSSLALAKKAHIRAYSYFDSGDQRSQQECDGESKVPRKLKRQSDIGKNHSGYLGSEFIAPEAPGDKDAWKHFFSSKSACDASLKSKALKAENP
jgi:hypothetical protein